MRGRKVLLSIVMVLLVLSLSLSAMAADSVIDWTRTGSLTLKLLDSGDGTPVAGAEVTVFEVATLSAVDGLLEYTLTSDFAECGISLEDLQDTALADQFAAYTKEKGLEGSKATTDTEGIVKFSDLSLGVYLVFQNGGAGYTVSKPFLITLPTSDEDEWVYDLTAEPKTGIERLMDLTVTKAWEDTGKNRPTFITVELVCDEEVVEQVTLSDENNWTHTWTDLLASKNWDVTESEVPAGYTVTYSREGNEITILNAKKLIQTGQLNWPVPVLAVGGVLLFAFGWALVFMKKQKN